MAGQKQNVAEVISSASVTTSQSEEKTKGLKLERLNPFAKKTAVTEETVYDFYKDNFFPALWSSIPVLLSRMTHDTTDLVKLGGSKFLHFLSLH
jgi:hypothetical protein